MAQIQLKVFKCALHSISKKKTISKHKIIKMMPALSFYLVPQPFLRDKRARDGLPLLTRTCSLASEL